MALLLIVFGVMLAIATWNNQENALFTMLESDIASGGFLAILAVMIILSFAANVPSFNKPAKMFGALLIVVLLLTSGSGIFSQIKAQLSNVNANPLAQAPAGFPTGNPTINLASGGASGGSPVSSALGAASSVASVLPALGLL
jgi:hypothetical protein